MIQREQFEKVNEALLVLAPAKLNLSLLIAGKRPDGFHEIETVMSKIDFYDELTIEHGNKKAIEVACTGKEWAPQGRENLIYQACELLFDNSGCNADIKITLKKNVPAGKGLGSASSDAASTLIGVNKFLKLGFKSDQLHKMGARLGSDVCFFLDGSVAFCGGKGEQIKKTWKNFNFLALVILPDISVSTETVYKNYKHNTAVYERLSKQINGYIKKNRIDLIPKMCANMLEECCFGLNREVAELKKKIEFAGIRPLCLSGSGSALYYMVEGSDEQQAKKCKDIVEKEIGCKSVIVHNNRW